MGASTIKALLTKEFLCMKRNPLIPRVIILLPLISMLFIPLVADLDVKHCAVAVVDNDRSQLSRRIISDIDGSDRMTVVEVSPDHNAAMRLIESGKADVLLTIPVHYAADMTLGRSPKADLEANGINAIKATLGSQYVASSIGGSIKRWFAESGHISTPSGSVNVLNRYNPTLNYRNYMIPALIVILLIIICGFMPSMNLVNEKERGTIEAMNVTPVGRFQFVLSKLIPYWLVGLAVVSIGMLIGLTVYGLKPIGNIGVFYLASILFSLIMSGIAIMIANSSRTLMQTMFVMFAVVIIFILMSGLFTPIESMPMWSQTITYGVPARYFIEIMRAIYLRGTPISELWAQFTALASFAFFFCLLAALTYKKQV